MDSRSFRSVTFPHPPASALFPAMKREEWAFRRHQLFIVYFNPMHCRRNRHVASSPPRNRAIPLAFFSGRAPIDNISSRNREKRAATFDVLPLRRAIVDYSLIRRALETNHRRIGTNVDPLFRGQNGDVGPSNVTWSGIRAEMRVIFRDTCASKWITPNKYKSTIQTFLHNAVVAS